ncbi:Protein of unknown function with HXXEE motif-containing protein [Lutibacter oceani]|uniref:HXXEE domain-containing protein n=1 Tax=Lutibacter oceani TaxID=1853311 RepID=A0A3D9S2S2_9FLAO|nr:HXXEE domain-containing protein [Lutibacter oceani]REE84461.1 Protein of unknown function with HXXEE motif-containing protein [Lutibacter oceani]
MTKLNKHILIPLVIASIAIVIFWIVSLTLNSVIVFIPGVIVSYLLYLNTFYKKTPNPERILPLYLLALGIQFIHFTEEYLTDFTIEVPKLLGREEYPLDYWLVFNMVAYFVFIIGGIILFKKIKELMIIPLFFILVGVLLNSIGHILISLYVGGYFSGLYTALIYIVIGPILIKRVLDETKVVKMD